MEGYIVITCSLTLAKSCFLHKFYKMQLETADFAPGAATWRTRRNIRIVFDSGSFALLCETMTSSAKPEVHNISKPSKEDHKKFGRIWTCDF